MQKIVLNFLDIVQVYVTIDKFLWSGSELFE